MKIWKGYKSKIGPEKEKEIRGLRDQHWSLSRLARHFDVSIETIKYHLYPEYKRALLERAKKWMKKNAASKNYDRKAGKYFSERYQQDKEFRERVLRHVKKSDHKIVERNRKIRLPDGMKMTCPYCSFQWSVRSALSARCSNCKTLLRRLPPEVIGYAKKEEG